jgi:hypothetical protein
MTGMDSLIESQPRLTIEGGIPIIVSVPNIGAPFSDVAVNIVEAEGVGWITTHGGSASYVITWWFVGVGIEGGIIVSLGSG